MSETQKFVLVVGAACSNLADLCAQLTRERHRVLVLHNVSGAVARAAEPDIAAVVLYVDFPDGGGIELLRGLRATSKRYVPVMVVSAEDNCALRLAALKLGADDVLDVEGDSEELLARLQRSIQLSRRFDALLRDTEHLRALSVTDGLTQIHNHRFFQERLKEEFRRAQRYDEPLALIFLDVDHFKDVNDRFGHAAGDLVLRDVANAIRSAVRETDLLARYGGEEFSVLLPRTHLSGALTVAERMARALEEMRTGPSGTLKITASVGISGFPGQSVLTSDQLIGTADEALYQAKREGRNTICLFQQVPYFPEHPARAG